MIFIIHGEARPPPYESSQSPVPGWHPGTGAVTRQPVSGRRF